MAVSVKKYRKKPVTVEAIQLTVENVYQVAEWCRGSTDGTALTITTLEGDMTGQTGDYIIKGVAGEFYPCRADIFESTYEVT